MALKLFYLVPITLIITGIISNNFDGLGVNGEKGLKDISELDAVASDGKEVQFDDEDVRGSRLKRSMTNSNVEGVDEDEEPKRLVVYFNFERMSKHGRVQDKSGYENSGALGQGAEILQFSDKDYTCNQAAHLNNHDIYLRGDTFQAKPKSAITIAAWIKLDKTSGEHSVFNTIGSSHTQGQYHFEVNDRVIRWFHRNEYEVVVFETFASTVLKGEWTHITGTYDSKTKEAKVFINGEMRNQSIGDGQLSRDWGVRAGIGDHEKCRSLRGSLDEFRIYNYALKPDEIKALVSACKASSGDDAAPAQTTNPDPVTGEAAPEGDEVGS